MQIVIKSTPDQQTALASFFSNLDAQLIWIEGNDHIPEADLYFDCCFESEGYSFPLITQQPVFINAVVQFGESIPSNCIRFNGWSGFLHELSIEIASSNSNLLDQGVQLLSKLKKKALIAPNQPGMVSARVVAMIVNEAYFALGEAISSKKDIDTAMKLGTNYPFGPFEWSEKIGLKNIYSLLQKLNESSARYAIAPAMIKELNQ
ncbi:MAG: 3-hydroxyacyl-CoA dehydrogenase family protein [Sphingobacteriia bacterium]|jgi:3-hydroxybutyryl-CoA dehydrogenase